MQNKLQLTARAKVNLTLQVTGRRDDGYHNLVSLVTFADLGDKIHINQTNTGSTYQTMLSGEFAYLLNEKENLIGESIKYLSKNNLLDQIPATKSSKVANTIELNKIIPVGAGLGGGSADSACIISALIKNDHLKYQKNILDDIAKNIGADVPVCILGKTCIMQGIGDKITPISLQSSIPAVLIWPKVSLITKQMFQKLSSNDYIKEPDICQKIVNQQPLSLQEIIAIVNSTPSSFEAPARLLCDEVSALLDYLRACDDISAAGLSGSGSACFALCETTIDSKNAARRIKDMFPDYWVKATVLGN